MSSFCIVTKGIIPFKLELITEHQSIRVFPPTFVIVLPQLLSDIYPGKHR